MTITDIQTEAFVDAIYEVARIDLMGKTIVPTQTALADFVKTHGPASETQEANGLTVHIWSGHKRRSIFDLCAGNLYVVAFGDDSLAHVERNVWKRCSEE